MRQLQPKLRVRIGLRSSQSYCWEETIMARIILLPAALFMCFGLASCGGGAKLTINPGAAQDITGGSAPVETAARQTERARNLAFRSDSILFSAVHFQTTIPRYSNLVANIRCWPTYCNASIPALNYSNSYSVSSVSNSVFSGTRRAQPVLTESGVTLVERAWEGTTTSGRTELPNHGNSLVAVQSYSAFGSATETISYLSETFIGRYSVAFGERTGREPITSGVWRGQMTAITQNADDLLQGDATLRYTISGNRGELSADFTDIKNLSQNTAHAYSSVRFRDVSVSSSGTYSQGYQGNRIEGAFYGSSAVETAGTFEKYGMLGAFGAQR